MRKINIKWIQNIAVQKKKQKSNYVLNILAYISYDQIKANKVIFNYSEKCCVILFSFLCEMHTWYLK